MRTRLPVGRSLALAALLALSATGCARRLPPASFTEGPVEVACCGRADEPVEVTYLGAGGWIFRKGAAAVMTAPLYSNPSFLEAGLWLIRANPERIERHLPDVSDVTAILVGHGHYDHLMDVPYVALNRAPRALVYGNETVAHQLAPSGLPAGRVRRIGPDDLGNVERPGRWMDVGPGVRVMPLLSDHGPHMAGITLYSGVRSRDMTRLPEKSTEWLDGETVAYLIDLLNGDGSVALRVYYQDAVAAPPYGLVPPMDDGLGVDVALLVPATYAEVEWHPEALLDNARPRHVLLGHWEDFFQPPDREPHPVVGTNLPGFVSRLRRALPSGTGWHMPVPGTRFVFR